MRQVGLVQGIPTGPPAPSRRREVAGMRRLRQGLSQEDHVGRAQEDAHWRETILVRYLRKVFHAALDARHT